MATTTTSSIKSVVDMYMSHPFPQWTREERHRRLGAELARYRFLGLAEQMKGGRFLDVGCGTGNRSMLIAKTLGVGEFVGIDPSTASLRIARRVAEEEAFDRFIPVQADVFDIPFPDESFDVVVSWGVLHHTSDPLAGFAEMTRVCRRGGLLGIFLYNRYNHWRHNQQKAKVSRRGGDDVESRFKAAHELYGEKPAEDMTPEEIAVFYDRYCHPHKSDHTLGELLGWFDRLDLEFWGSYPPLRLSDFLAYLRYRGELRKNHPPRGRANRVLAKAATRLPPIGKTTPPFASPTLLHRFTWQTFWAWQGRAGGYSGGASLSARRAPAPNASRPR